MEGLEEKKRKKKIVLLTSRSPSHDNTPLLQRCPLRKIRDQVLAVEEKIPNRLLLAHLPINNSLQLQLRWIRNLSRCNQHRAERRKRAKALGEPPLRDCASVRGIALELARRDVVAHRIGCDVVQGGPNGDVLCIWSVRIISYVENTLK